MDRNVYSLVLIDDVVDAVDKMAYEKNTSRSNLINQILAEYLSCPTPEMRIKDIFGCVEEMMAGIDYFQMQFQPSDTMISIRSALKYRYQPNIRYVLELYRVCEPTVGELRVSMRTQSQPLIDILTDFFEFWAGLENKYIGSLFSNGQVYFRIEPGRYIRQFLPPSNEAQRTNEAVANAISEYIRMFDASLKQYFAELDNLEETALELENEYRDFIKSGVMI
jgi:hypothetical protein